MTDTLHAEARTLYWNEHALLADLAEGISTVADPLEVGLFLHLTAEKPAARQVFSIGNFAGIARFTVCHRYEPFWMKAMAGTRAGEVPVETQILIAEATDGNCIVFVPLLDRAFRASLQGTGENGLELVAESADPTVVTTGVTGLFVAVGADPYVLMESAARSVMAWLGTGRLRREKELPAFADQFGWCTWDSFYQEVSEEKVRLGLESFAIGGVLPKLLILDDGWQSVREMPFGGQRVTAFPANEKFPGDLGSTVTMAKSEFGIETFLVWHALMGYWGGVDGDTLTGYGVRNIARSYSPGILHHMPTLNDWWGSVPGVVPPEHIYRFFQDYHRHLRQQGVDGVKVDVQAALEGVAAGLGGRVPLMQHYHEALEGSVQTHFRGALINCMSCAAEMLYGTLNSTITRTSTDFWPNQPESHGLHLYVNAQVSLWFGEFIHPDWDMFQSGHPMGTYHAAGRAVGGCPVYVSDKPDAHDFEVLRKLVLTDGGILRADLPGRPTRDCLFYDPTREDVLLKIFNLNLDAGIIGAFNARYGEPGAEIAPITGAIRPSDVAGLEGERYAVYAHYARELRVLEREKAWEITLPQLQCEVFTLVPIRDGLAPLGLIEMFNSAGAIREKGFVTAEIYEVTLHGAGRFAAWSEKRPVSVEMEGSAVDFSFDAATHWLEITVPEDASALRFYFKD